MPSGPAAEVEASSLIESIIIDSVISRSVRHSSGLMDWFEKKETGSWTIILATGEVKTLLNWSNNKEHISSLSLTSNCVCGLKRGPISLLHMVESHENGAI